MVVKYDASQRTTTFNVHITINKNQRQRKMTAAGTVEQEQNTYVKHQTDNMVKNACYSFLIVSAVL